MDLNDKAKERNFFSATSKKSIQEFIESVKENALRFHFGVRQVFDMKEMHKNQGVDVDDDFQMYQVIVCNFGRSYKSIRKNVERAAVLLQPKQIIVFVKEGMTRINYLPFTKEFIAQALPGDDEFHGGLFESCQRIIELIEASK